MNSDVLSDLNLSRIKNMYTYVLTEEKVDDIISKHSSKPGVKVKSNAHQVFISNIDNAENEQVLEITMFFNTETGRRVFEELYAGNKVSKIIRK